MLENVPKHALSCTGVGTKAARSLLGGSLVRLAGTTDLVQVHFGTIDSKGHRMLLLQVRLHYPFTSVTVLVAMYIPVGYDFATWAARYNTQLCITSTPKGVVFSFLFCSMTLLHIATAGLLEKQQELC